MPIVSLISDAPKEKYVIASQSSSNYGMIATGNHDRFGFAARSTTGVAIS